MTWFKVDDGFWSHPKTMTLTPEAVALWVRAGSYCGKHLTDGFVPRVMLPMLQAVEPHARELVTAGLWIEIVDGWQFHQWADYQDTKDAVEKRRKAWKTQKAKQRDPSSLTIPFLSKGSADSGQDSGAESGMESGADIPCLHGEQRGPSKCALCRKAATG